MSTTASLTLTKLNFHIVKCKKRQNMNGSDERKGHGDTDLREPLDVLRQRPHAAPVVVVEELDHGGVHRVV